MAGSKTIYLEKKLLDHVLGNTAYTPPGTLYVALSTQAFDPAATGTAMNELTGGAYGRASMTNNTTNWPAAADGNPADKANGADITFTTATADWTTILSAYLVDATGGFGNALYGADFTTPQTVTNGQTFKIDAGLWVFQET